MRRSLALPAGAGLVLGICAEQAGFAWSDVSGWLPDLLVGWTLLGTGFLSRAWRPDASLGGLLLAAGATWFVGNFGSLDWALLAWPARNLLYLHRGFLVHAVVSYPTGRRRGWLDRVVIAAGYGTAAWTRLGGSTLWPIAMGAVLVLVAGRNVLVRTTVARHAVAPQAFAAVLLGCALAGTGSLRHVVPADVILFGYQAGCAIVGVVLTVGLRADRSGRAVTDLIVQLSAGRSRQVRDALAHALGDPSLEIGYWVPEAGRYVEADGAPFDPPVGAPGRTMTTVRSGAEPVAVLVHDPGVLRDSAVLDSIGAAAGLAAVNARLQADVRTTADEVRASRLRLMTADDAERIRIEAEVHERAQSLTDLAGTLALLRRRADERSDPELRRLVDVARQRLDEAQCDLLELAAGLHPRALTEAGLAAAVRELAARSTVPTEVRVAVTDVPPEIAAAGYFACAEALANVLKHAQASRCYLGIDGDGHRVRVEVSDDGVGGADLARGSGLRGLADRVEALGGVLTVEAAVPHGTRVRAEIPLSR